MKTNSKIMLPKNESEIPNGGLYQQSVRCGKSRCRCASGDLHQGYFYFIRRVQGRLKKTYVPKDRAEAFSLLLQKARKGRHDERVNRRSSQRLLNEFAGVLREHRVYVRNRLEEIEENDC